MSRLVVTIRNSTLVTGWLKLELWSIISTIVQILIHLVCSSPLATSTGPEVSRMRKTNACTVHTCRRDFYFLSPLIINKVMSHSICPWYMFTPKVRVGTPKIIKKERDKSNTMPCWHPGTHPFLRQLCFVISREKHPHVGALTKRATFFLFKIYTLRLPDSLARLSTITFCHPLKGSNNVINGVLD